MPIYEYMCKDKECGEVVEKIRKHADMDKPTPCPKCEGETGRKISKTSFILEGGGWASDGYDG